MTKLENENAFQKIPTNNISGVKNVHYHSVKNMWTYKKTKYKKTHFKYFKTFEEACEYKRNYELT